MSIDAQLQKLGEICHAPVAAAINRLHLDALATQYHLHRSRHPRMVAILGGTGTGKSTLLNRLIGSELSASSFMRTFTAGAVAVVQDEQTLPSNWLHLPVEVLSALPARGELDKLIVIRHPSELTSRISLIDTPDVDGDNAAHHQQADRVFRWCDAVIFLVTPEKYQMTELRSYYRLAQRYAIPAIFVMNKVDEPAPAEDFSRQMAGAKVFVLPRDDSSYEPDGTLRIDALRESLLQLGAADDESRARGITARVTDWLNRLKDTVLEPLKEDRRAADGLIASISAMETASASVDVNPITRQLQRRLQQRSVLYLMGPGRVLDRVRQVPGLLARLPRTTWDLFRHGQFRKGGNDDLPKDFDGKVPDFQANLIDQFTIVQSRIEDAIRSVPAGERWAGDAACEFNSQKLAPARAGEIASDELLNLRTWLEQHWDATPRDTRVLKALLKVLPGAERLTKWSEAAPYLLAIVVATHHAFFGPVDLLIVGGFSLATWLTEKISNEVASQAKLTNTRISERFAKLSHEQIRRTCDWLNARAPGVRELNALEKSINELHSRMG